MIELRKSLCWSLPLTLVGVAIFMSLGFWQLRRADFKEQMLARFAHATSQPVQPLADVVGQVEEERYPHVVVRGKLKRDRLYVLDNRSRHGRPGILVFAPMLVCADSAACRGYRSDVLLVALGFLPRDNGWQSLPDLPPIRDQLVSLQGLYAPPPGKGIELGGNALAKQQDWPKVTTYLDLGQVSDDLNAPLEPRVLLVDPDPASAYVRLWTPETMPPARHRGYALTWFGFAAASIVIFVILNRRRPRSEKDHEQA